MGDDVTKPDSDRSDDEPLRKLAEAAREAMLRTEGRLAHPQACPSDRAFAVFFIDAMLGFVCLCTGMFSVNLLFEGWVTGGYRAVGDWIMLMIASATPLLYSGLDVMVGGTPGKLLMKVTIAGPARLKRALLRRWAIKGAPFMLALVLSTLSAPFGLLGTGSAFEGWMAGVTLCLLVGFSWWLIASAVDGKGQTWADWMAGTRLCLPGTCEGTTGFEPVMSAPRDESARRNA